MSRLHQTRRLLEAAGVPAQMISGDWIRWWLNQGKAPEDIVKIAGPVRLVLR
jgi:hypothetical protein